MSISAAGSQPLESVAFALWGNAVVDGRSSLDDAGEAISAGSPHRVLLSSGLVSIPVALGRLRAAGARGFGAALPIPGDPLGLGGPVPFNEAALAAGQAVLVPELRAGLIPDAVDSDPPVVCWRLWTDLPSVPTFDGVSTARRTLREAVLGAAAELAELDPPTARSAQPTAREIDRFRVPSGLPSSAYDLVQQALRLLPAIRAALDDSSAVLGASLDRRRRAALLPVERAVRRALVSVAQPPYDSYPSQAVG